MSSSTPEEPTEAAANASIETEHQPHTKRPRPDESSKTTASNSTDEKKVKRLSNKKIPSEVLKVRRAVQTCCATNDLATAMNVYENALQNNVRVEPQSFYNLLSLCGGLEHRGVHIGTPKSSSTTCGVEKKDKGNKGSSPKQEKESQKLVEISNEKRKEYAFSIKSKMDELSFPLNETAYSALLRMLAKEHNFDQAMQLLTEAEGVSQCKPRLRMYSSLLCAYCSVGSMVPALQLWGRLGRRGLVVTEREYTALMQCATKVKDAIVMERVLSDLAEDVLVPSRETLRAITDWFECSSCAVRDDESESPQPPLQTTALSRANSIYNVQLPRSEAPTMGPMTCPVTHHWIVSRDCQVDSTTGRLITGCLQGNTLQPIRLSPDTWTKMRQDNETIVLQGMLESHTSQFQGGGKGRKRVKKDVHTAERKKQHWQAFQSYLAQRPDLDVVIDGANVGYYKQNFAHAPKHVDYHQIDWLLTHLRQLHKSVLLVLHERHFQPNLMPPWARAVVEKWQNVLYRAPAGMNDDWFWLHAALSQKVAWVITNDEMRDHYFQMLAPRSFVRWKERHQVHFDFGAWDESRKSRRVQLVTPHPYSRRLQRLCGEEGEGGLVVPLAKRGDEHRYLDGSHTAETDPPEETYVCIRAVRRTKSSS